MQLGSTTAFWNKGGCSLTDNSWKMVSKNELIWNASTQKEYIKRGTQGSGSTVRGMLAISTEAFIYSVSKANPGQFAT